MSAAAAARAGLGLGEGAGGPSGGPSGGGDGAGGTLNRFVQLPARPRAAVQCLSTPCSPALGIMECLARHQWQGHLPPPSSQNRLFFPVHPKKCPSLPVVLHGNNLLVFGGTGIPFGESNGNDVHVCNVKYKRWALLSCRGKKPNRIYGQAMAIINGCLYVFGGTTGYIYSTDLHRLDLSTREWVQLKPNNMSCDMPEERWAREGFWDCWQARREELARIWECGKGFAGTLSPSPGELGGIHAYNLETNTWEEIPTKPHEKVGESGNFPGKTGAGESWRSWNVGVGALPFFPGRNSVSVFPQAGCMYVHGGVVNIHENKRTGSLFKLWLVVPSLLELCWEKLLEYFPHLATLSRPQLLHLGLTQGLVERLK
ncbi:PREDICTED: kelch domain-containing protein 10 [Lepidothrix coronata]|uniref:Kelch domain-containing protein 10 n=1 Tax=Lepidothrix coronata TaxID=321398 RepID=A0A6J0J715_9PASS|nr:PREDICTED: kelch domain-containing protein 10 [Lepidothrix coronata]